MRIKITSTLPKSLRPDAVCRFHESGRGYQQPRHDKGLPDPPPDAPFVIGAERSWLSFRFYIENYASYDTPEARRVAGGVSVRELRRANGAKLVWLLDGRVSLEQFNQLVTGGLLASYTYDAYKSKPRSNAEPQLTVVAGGNARAFRAEVRRLQAIDAGVCTARDLGNAPAGDLVPLDLADYARQLAKAEGLAFKSMSAKQLERAGYIGLTSVGRGSANPPVMFTLTHTPARPRRGAKHLCLVGKGLCFDAGGINLKPWDGMWDMKADMGGAAAVIGAMQAIARLNLPVPVTAVVAAAQNMPDGKAYLPSDVLRFRNGRTVEIQNTDAEGRLALADALLYAQKTLRQRRIVDFSTLTGASARALGNVYIGLMSRSPELKAAVLAAADASGELAWELPLHPEYRELLKSTIADVRNIGGPLAGAQTAAWFLHEFIDGGTEYVHLDIAGTFVAKKEDKYWGQAGMTGSGTRLAVTLAERSAGIEATGT